MDFSYNFQPRQIVYLEHERIRLYTEVIQVVESRQVCWVRPLLLAGFTSSDDSSVNLLSSDLRSSADLLWPLSLFRPALDTEIIPLLTQLWASAPQPYRNPVGQKHLNQFINQAWQAQRKKGEERTYEE